MKCTIKAENKDIFCAVVNELTDWGNMYEVLPWIQTVNVLWTTKAVLEEFLDSCHLNREHLIIVEI